MWTPNCIDYLLSLELHDSLNAYPHVVKTKKHLTANGWNFWVVTQRRGRCYPTKKTITIPAWTFNNPKRGKDFHVYYICHEMAHAFGHDNHNVAFMKCFMGICPKELQHHEIGYKPRAAVTAGISLLDIL